MLLAVRPSPMQLVGFEKKMRYQLSKLVEHPSDEGRVNCQRANTCQRRSLKAHCAAKSTQEQAHRGNGIPRERAPAATPFNYKEHQEQSLDGKRDGCDAAKACLYSNF